MSLLLAVALSLAAFSGNQQFVASRIRKSNGETIAGKMSGVVVVKLNGTTDMAAYDALFLMSTVKIDFHTRKKDVRGEPYFCSYALVLAEEITAIDEQGVHGAKGARGVCLPPIVLGEVSKNAGISEADIKSLELPAMDRLRDLVANAGSKDKESDWCNFKFPRGRSVCGLGVSLDRGIPGKPMGEFRVSGNEVTFNADIEVTTEKGTVKVPVGEIVKHH